MKNNVLYLLPAILFLLPACQREVIQPEDKDQTPGGPQKVSVTIDQGTRTTVSEKTGLISFSSGDAIKIFNNSGIHIGVTASSSTHGDFSMDDGFSASGSGYAGFPANLVADMSTVGVKFRLPYTYVFSDVGGQDIETSNVPCPMMGSVSGAGGIILQPACAIVRFYVSDVKAGSLSFTFPTHVTGTTGSIPTLDGTGGISASDLSDAGRTITVTGVPTVGIARFICITLPVPTGTTPGNIVVKNRPEDGSALRYVSIDGSSTALARAGGHKLMVTSFTNIEAVDLGIEVDGKRILWANMNVGAASESDYGDYFAWGEVEPYYSSLDPLAWKTGKSAGYDWPSYQCEDGSSFTKYTGSDDKPVLDLSDDAAHVNCGGNWRMPTYAELNALYATKSNTTDYEWVWYDGSTNKYNNSSVAGYLIMSKKSATYGNHIFLPAAGCWYGTSLEEVGDSGYYWSSSLYSGRPLGAWCLDFYSGYAYYRDYGRYFGCSVRPVLEL